MLSILSHQGKANQNYFLRFHLTPVRMAKINNTSDSLCQQGCGARGTLLYSRSANLYSHNDDQCDSYS